ncbi:MAG: hypothetical protein AB7Q27_07350 [Acidimicrobiia bacterium]
MSAGVAGAAPKPSFGTVDPHTRLVVNVLSCQQLYNRWHNLDSKPVSQLTPEQRTDKSETLKRYNDAGCKGGYGSIVSAYTKFK